MIENAIGSGDNHHGLDGSCQVVISSPLSRAIETSLLIFGESMPPARFLGGMSLVRKNDVQGKPGYIYLEPQ